MLYQMFNCGLMKGASLFKANVPESLLRCVSPLASQLLPCVRQMSFAMQPLYGLQSPILSISPQQPTKCLLNINDIWKTSSRSVTKFSLKSGKKNSVRTSLHRFYRLDHGCWIRRRGGHDSGKYKKSERRLWFDQQHVFCTKTQSIMLDKMVTGFWKKKKYYIDDPFEPYQVRNNFDWVPPFRKR